MTVSPCKYPGCDRDNGDPQLTDLGMCEPCQRRYGRLLEWLVEDWAILHTVMPAPVRRSASAKSSNRVYGHPREWASDTAASIAGRMYWTAAELAEALGEKPPRRAIREAGTLRAAYRYLEPRVEQLALMEGAEAAAAELNELHRRTRSALGKTRAVARLKGVPCLECNACALVLSEDNAVCESCGRIFERRLFGLVARHWVDSLIEKYDAEHAIHA